ncbi:MAG: TlpA disulfide reductase family protein [Bacteroidota bacterium]
MIRTILVTSLFLSIAFTSSAQNTNIPVVEFNQLEPFLHKQNDTTYLINFWASWCVPCLEEMPALEKIKEKYQSQKFKILLVSLDQPDQVGSRLLPAIKRLNITSDVILLDDPDFNSWISKVNPNWEGAIPATLIYNNSNRKFYNKSFEFYELDSIINQKFIRYEKVN